MISASKLFGSSHRYAQNHHEYFRHSAQWIQVIYNAFRRNRLINYLATAFTDWELASLNFLVRDCSKNAISIDALVELCVCWCVQICRDVHKYRKIIFSSILNSILCPDILTDFFFYLRLCRSLPSWLWIFWSPAFHTSCYGMRTMLCTNKVSHPLPE